MRVYIITFIITALIIFNINIIKIQSYLIHFTLLIPFIVYALLITHNLILLILIIELVGTIYLFFFLNTDSITTYSTIKLKNLISNYILFSFITLIFFLFSILLLLKNIGTVNFTELELTYLYVDKLIFLSLIISMV